MPSIDNVTLAQIRMRINGAAPRHPGFESRCVATFDYNLEEEILTIEFQERGTYNYMGVPLPVFVELAESESQGRYFNLYIKDTYSYERVA